MIYVDDLRKWNGRAWCHLMTDGNIDELHQFAQSIGLRRSWFQDDKLHPHYDLSANKRRVAIRAGAQAVTARELVRKCSAFFNR